MYLVYPSITGSVCSAMNPLRAGGSVANLYLVSLRVLSNTKWHTLVASESLIISSLTITWFILQSLAGLSVVSAMNRLRAGGTVVNLYLVSLRVLSSTECRTLVARLSSLVNVSSPICSVAQAGFWKHGTRKFNSKSNLNTFPYEDGT